MKIQEEHIDLKNGIHYFEQTFITQTVFIMNYKDYDNLKMFIEICAKLMSEGRHIELLYKDITDLQ